MVELGPLVERLEALDQSWKLHPILVNFTAALVPVSVLSDIAGRLFHRVSLRTVGQWTMLYAGLVTPLTAFFGWLFWMKDDSAPDAIVRMTVHKWLGTGLAVALLGLLVWRVTIARKDRWPSPLYLLVGLIVVSVLVVQGNLGGDQTFSSM